MSAFVPIIRDILLLRRGPQDLPYAPGALIAIVALCLIVQTGATAVFAETSFDRAFAASVVEVALNLVAVSFLLGMRNLRNRFVQTASAILLCDLAFTLLGLGVAMLIKMAEVGTDQLTPAQSLLQLLLIPLVLWEIAVDGHILRHSLNIPLWVGIALSVFLTIAITAMSSVSNAP
jgi:hypothetical protein